MNNGRGDVVDLSEFRNESTKQAIDADSRIALDLSIEIAGLIDVIKAKLIEGENSIRDGQQLKALIESVRSQVFGSTRENSDGLIDAMQWIEIRKKLDKITLSDPEINRSDVL
ncbi:hypothetical protein LAT59_03385 [Candidatus Gracilibacteria bacterium]|nr:hypothetical protein [Candidatus Gracilibacteria bacterium]